MEKRKTKTLQCKCCLTKNDLVLLTPEKQKIISSLLNIPSPRNLNDARICINCNSTLSCIDKFRQNSLRANTILEKCKLKNTFLSSVTDESVNSAFDTILNWMNDVTVILKYYLTDVKEDPMKENESESVHEEENYDGIHEEELFVGSVEEGESLKEEMEVDELEKSDEAQVKCEPDYATDDSESAEEDEEEYTPIQFEQKKMKVGKGTNDNESKFECHLCDKKYALRADLMHHMNVHSGE